MTKRIGWHSASAVITAAPGAPEVIVVTMHGPLTPAALMHFRRQILAHHCAGVRALAVDFTAGVIAFDGDALDASLAPMAGLLPHEARPAALIVKPESIAMFRGHAMRVAGRYGVTRCIFSAVGPALDWARDVAERHPPPQASELERS